MEVSRSNVCALALALAGVVASPAGAGVAAGPYRDAPVVLHGADLPNAAAHALTETNLAGYRWTAGAWQELPLQVDGFFEQQTCRTEGGTERCFTENRPALSDAADPDPDLDADDEVVFLGREVGAERAPADAPPPAGVDSPAVRYEVEVRAPQGDAGWVYLFKKAGGGTARYTFELYTTDLALHPDGEQLTPPEDTALACTGSDPNQITHFASDYFCAHYATRWSLDDLVRRTSDSDCAPDASFTGTRLGDPTYEYPDDLLDRFKGHEAEPGADPDDAAWGRCSTMRGERIGPVRYVRGTLGAKSGVTTTVYSYFYPRRIDIETRLGVHVMSGIARLLDWNDHARDARLYHRHDLGEALTASATVDGASCGAGSPSCPAGTDGGFRVYDRTSQATKTASTYDILVPGFRMWDYLVTARGRVHVSWALVSDPTTYASYFRFLYYDSDTAPLNPATNWEEHRASMGDTGIWFDLVRETYTDRFVMRNTFQLLDPEPAKTDAQNLADGDAIADVVRRPLATAVTEGGGSQGPSPPPPPTGLTVD